MGFFVCIARTPPATYARVCNDAKKIVESFHEVGGTWHIRGGKNV